MALPAPILRLPHAECVVEYVADLAQAGVRLLCLHGEDCGCRGFEAARIMLSYLLNGGNMTPIELRALKNRAKDAIQFARTAQGYDMTHLEYLVEVLGRDVQNLVDELLSSRLPNKAQGSHEQ